MKQLLLLILFLSNTLLFSQNYLNQTARWNQTVTWSGMDAYSECNYIRYFLGDTILNGKSYMKLYTAKDCYMESSYWDIDLGEMIYEYSYNSDTTFTGYLREEMSKFYWISDINYPENMLYNFDIQSNTIVTTDVVYNSGCDPNAEILTYENVCIGSIARKKWSVSTGDYFYIEGVGPTEGFLSGLCTYNGCPECTYTLNSFELNGDFLYTGTCSGVGVKENDETINLVLEPNPVNHILSIKLAKFDSYQLRLIDFTGKTLFETNGDFKDYKIDCSSFNSGAYLLQVTGSKSNFQQRFMKY